MMLFELKNFYLKFVLGFFVIFVFVGLKNNFCLWAEDLMEKAFAPARNYETIVNMWNDKMAVGSDVVWGGTTVSISLEEWLEVDSKAPMIVRITKFLLRMTIVLSITMVIYNGIQYILQSTSGSDTKWATKNLWLIAGGIVLALLSLAIIQLIQSLTLSSLNF